MRCSLILARTVGEEVEKRGVEIGNFISPEANFACWGEDKVVGQGVG